MASQTALLVLSFLYAILVIAHATIPDGFLLSVESDCGESMQENATIAVNTDMVLIHATAECANGVFLFTHVRDIRFELEVAYPPAESNNCIFHRMADKDVYYVPVKVSYGNPSLEIQQMTELVSATCSFTHKADDYSPDHEILDGLIAPTELQSLQTASDANMGLVLTDVLGKDLTGTTIKMGRTIQIKLEGTAAEGVVGINPVSCDAVAEDKRYAILRAGCGDGVVFKKPEGFTTEGMISRSPYFKAFAVGRATILNIECNVSTCATTCDGSTCDVERKRRSADGGGETFIVATAVQQLVQAPLHMDVSWKNIEPDTNLDDGSGDDRPYHVFGSVQQYPVSNHSEPKALKQQTSNETRIIHAETANLNATHIQASTHLTGHVVKVQSKFNKKTPTEGLRMLSSGSVKIVKNGSGHSLRLENEDKRENTTTKQSTTTTAVTTRKPKRVSAKSRVQVIKSGEVFVKEVLETHSHSKSTPPARPTTTTAIRNETKVDNSEEELLNRVRPMYITGLIIAGLFSLASLALGIHLYRQQHKTI